MLKSVILNLEETAMALLHVATNPPPADVASHLVHMLNQLSVIILVPSKNLQS